MINPAVDDRDSGSTATTMTDCVHQQADQQHEPAQSSVVVSRDLRQAIQLLREVPIHADVNVKLRANKRRDADRIPLRAVNQRLSLPPQLPRPTDMEVSDDLAVRQCSSMTDDLVHTTDSKAASSERSTDGSRYVLPWKIRRVKKHKLDHVLVDATPSSSASSSSNYRHHHPQSNNDVVHRRLTSADYCADSDDDDVDEVDRGKQSASSESLDSIVERILENAALDAERQRSSKRKRQGRKMASCERDWWEEKHSVGKQDRNEQSLTTTNGPSAGDQHSASSSKHKHRKHRDAFRSSDNSRQPRVEKTLEDLFEEAVESLRGDAESMSPPVRHRRLRSAENWEREIYDSEVHDECRHYRLHAYTSRDTSHVSRGVALVQKLDKKPTPDLESSRKNMDHNLEQPRSNSMSSKSGTQSRDEAGDVSYLQRIVVSAKAALNDTRQPTTATDDGVDLGLDVELAANQRQRTSRSSSATWDSVSVDSLVIYDVDDTAVQAAALYSSNSAAAAAAQLDNEFVDKLRRLQQKWQQQSEIDTGGAADDHTETVWIPNNKHNHRDNMTSDTITQDTQHTAADSVTYESHQPKTDTTMTSLVDMDSGSILSDSVTTQQVVISIKLPRRSRRSPRRSKHRVPSVPFRELRLRREIRYCDDVETLNSTSAVVNDADPLISVTSSDDVMKVNDADELLTRTDDRVMLTAENLLSGTDLSTMFSDADVEYDDKDSSRSVELVPVYNGVGRPASQLVDVSRSEATRVVHFSSTTSSRLVYSTPSLMQIVDSIRLALVSRVRGGSRADGVSVSCEASETVSRRGDLSPPVVRNIVVDCLPSRRSPTDHDDHDDSGGENRTSDAS